MTLLIDLALLAFLVFIVVFDAKKGFLRASVGFARIFIAFALAFAFSGVVASLIDELWVFPTVHKSIRDAIISSVPTESELLSRIPIALRAVAALGDIDLQAIAESSSESALASSIARPISHCISAVIAFVLLLIGAYFALKLLVPLLAKAVRTVSLLKAADTFGGIVFGLFHAFLVGWALSLIGGFILSLLDISLHETYVIRFFNHVSPIKAIVWIFLR